MKQNDRLLELIRQGSAKKEAFVITVRSGDLSEVSTVKKTTQPIKRPTLAEMFHVK